jgi:hypothetical protein
LQRVHSVFRFAANLPVGVAPQDQTYSLPYDIVVIYH